MSHHTQLSMERLDDARRLFLDEYPSHSIYTLSDMMGICVLKHILATFTNLAIY